MTDPTDNEFLKLVQALPSPPKDFPQEQINIGEFISDYILATLALEEKTKAWIHFCTTTATIQQAIAKATKDTEIRLLNKQAKLD